MNCLEASIFNFRRKKIHIHASPQNMYDFHDRENMPCEKVWNGCFFRHCFQIIIILTVSDPDFSRQN